MSATYNSYTVEAMHNGLWFNIDHWYRNADGQMRHQYPLVFSERNLICETYENLLRFRRRMEFDELAPTTQEIICTGYPAFSRESLAQWDYFLWGDLGDLEAMLELEPDPNEYLTKDRFHEFVAEVRKLRYEFWRTIPYSPDRPSVENCPIRIIICQ